MRYYMVTAKCGHVGKGYYIPITFPIRAESAKEAASVTRAFPRVKHDHKDAILSVREADAVEYDDQWTVNNYDPYLMCKNRQDQQREYDGIFSRLVEEIRDRYECEKELPEKAVFSGKKRIRNVRQYAREQASVYAMLEAI